MADYKDPYRFPRALRAIQIKRKNALTEEQRYLILLEQQGIEEKAWGYWISDSVSWCDLENHECREDKLNALRWGIPEKEVKAERHRSLLAQAERYGIALRTIDDTAEVLGLVEQFADVSGPRLVKQFKAEQSLATSQFD